MRLLSGAIGAIALLVSPAFSAPGDSTTREPYLQLAGPPPWAPAHGRRAQEEDYQSYEEELVEEEQIEAAPYPAEDTVIEETVVEEMAHHHPQAPVVVIDGHCNHKAAGTVIGGVVGAAIGSRGDGRHVKRIAGAVIGALVGREIGKRMDRADGHCTSQALDHARDGEVVVWLNAQTRTHYRLTPIRSFRRHGRQCRRYRVESRYRRGGHSRESYSACRNRRGAWERL